MTATQIITIEDNTAPVISGGGADLTVQCADDVPAPGTVTATDDCDSDVTIQFLSTDSSQGEEICDIADAVGTNPNFWTLLINQLPAGLTSSWVLDADGATFTTFADGTATLTGRVVAADNPNLVFYMNYRAINKRDYSEWSSLATIPPSGSNRTYKDDAGFAAAGGDLWTTWDYYEIDAANSYLVGEEGLAGSMLNMTQAPSNYQFGWQVGQAANNINANFGMSTWFLYTGTVVLDGTTYNDVAGNGDINTDNSCAPNNNNACDGYEVVYTWTAIDDCGNMSMTTQTITVMDTTPPVMSECPANTTASCDNVPDAPAITATDNCDGSVPVNLEEEIVPGSCTGNYTLIRTWTADDACGNRTTCIQEIEVTDNVAPEFTSVPADVTIECTDDVPAAGDATATDNCGTVTITSDESTAGTCPVVITRTYTATDDCGNATTATQTITIEDNWNSNCNGRLRISNS